MLIRLQFPIRGSRRSCEGDRQGHMGSTRERSRKISSIRRYIYPPLTRTLVSAFDLYIGRFPQVSNIEFEFNPALPVGSRISHVKVGCDHIDLQREYVLVTRDYMTRGKGRSYIKAPLGTKAYST